MVCMMVREPSYDLRQCSFSEAWQEFVPQVISQKITQKSACQGCELVDLCSQCPGVAQLEGGNSEEIVRYYCEVAHLRAEAVKDLGSEKSK